MQPACRASVHSDCVGVCLLCTPTRLICSSHKQRLTMSLFGFLCIFMDSSGSHAGALTDAVVD